jgi:hypothetical protein
MEIVEGEANDHAVDIPRVNQDFLDQLVDRFSKKYPSTLPPQTGNNGNPCIFELPTRFESIFYKSIKPQAVALGPCHSSRNSTELQMMEERKWRCLAPFIESKKKGKLEEYLIQLRLLEKEVRECYFESETELLSTDELLQMMLVDGFFILALFFSAKVNLTELDRDERSIYKNPLYKLDMAILPKIYEDLLLLGNQIPSCVLKMLYRFCFNIGSRKSLIIIATNFFCSISIIPESRNMPTDRLHWLHLLDLVRLVFISRVDGKAIISRAHRKKMQINDYRPFSLIPCVTMLRRAGIKVKRHIADTFLDVKFKNGVIRMPDIILDDSMCTLLVNCVAFEQSCNISKHFSIYTTLLDCLVNTAKDINYLCDRGVIGNFVGTDARVAQFINDLGRGLNIYNDRDDDDYFFLFDVFEGVNKYYRRGLNWGKWTSFKSEYFGKPWLLISALVGLVLLVLTFLQTYYTIYAYKHPKN